MFAIEKNVPFVERTSQGDKNVYPFAAMKVGDSFYIPATVRRGSSSTASKRRLLQNYCQRYKSKTGFQFALRTVKGGFRIWRIK